MAKRNEEVFDIVEVRMLKQDCEQALKKIDEGIKWSGYAFLALIAMAVCMVAASIDGIIGALFGILMIAAFGAYVVCMILAIAKGGGLGRVLKTAGKIAKWAYYLIPFVFIDIFVAIYVVIVAFAMYLTMPIVFFFIIKHSLKKDLKAANLKEATAKKEELADFFNGYELFRQGKKKQAKAIMKKIASNKEHPFRKRASAMLGIYEPVSFGLKALWVGVTLVVMLMSTILESWLGLGTCLMLSGGGMIALALFAAWWDKKWRYGKQKKLCTFNGIMAKYDDAIPGTVIDIPKYPQTVGYGDYNDVNFDSSKAQTGQYHKDVSNVSEAIIENTRNIIKDVHELRIIRKEYYMNKCLEGDKAAKTVLQVLFDTEYKDGSFVENKQANTCKFISDKLAMIID